MTCKKCGRCCMEMDIGLSKQEVEAVQAGELDWPLQISPLGMYMLAQDPEDGGCPFLDRDTRLCKRYGQRRPAACSAFFCEG